MKLKTILILIAFILSFPAFSRPARKGPVALKQPDGTVVSARIAGDEFMHITTTSDGHAIIQDEEGWWCYASFGADGQRSSSGWRVGAKAPREVISGSRMIPYGALRASAARKRSYAPVSETSFIERLGTATKNGGSTIKNGIVILAEFSDVRFRYGRQDFVDMLTKEGYSRDGATGCAKEYFDEQFGGKVEFNFVISDIVTLRGSRKDYGANLPDGQDKDPARMIIEACQAVDGKVDFSLFDDDKDGEIDNVFVFFAGGDEAEGAGEDCIWSHSWYVHDGAEQTIMLDGRMLNRYACSSELAYDYENKGVGDTFTGIGTFCHEYCHTFDLADMYDTDYDGSGGTSAGLWSWTSLMDGGNQNNHGKTPPYFNAIEREMLGISNTIKITSDGTYILGPIEQTNTTYRIDTDNENEYYLLECRSGKGWDSHIGGSGLLLYHIDRSDRNSGYSDLYGRNLKASERWGMANEVNSRPEHQCADLIEADGRNDMFQNLVSGEFGNLCKDISTIFFPYDGIDYIMPESTPGYRFWSGAKAYASITDIRWENGQVCFNVSGISGADSAPVISEVTIEAFPDAAIVQFECSPNFEGNAVIQWGRTSEVTRSLEVQPYQPGRYAALIEGLTPDNKTYNISIRLESKEGMGEAKTASFMTKKAPSVNWPYIYMTGVKKNSDGTLPSGSRLPLKLCNAANAAEITWTFNGRAAEVGDDLYYQVHESGTLQAHIIWKDGSKETIRKEIIIHKED